MRTVLVTGGAGFIGSAVVPDLAARGYEVHVLDNLSFGRRGLIDIPDSRFHLIDLLDRESVEKTVLSVNPQWIIHLAAVHFIPYCNEHPYESANINILGTMHLLAAATQLKRLERLFFASTAAVYPVMDEAISETAPTVPLDIYGLSKLAGERLISEFHLRTAVPAIVCRFFNAFGPRETNPHLIPEIERQVRDGRRTIKLGNLDPKRDFIHTGDMSRAVALLMEKFNAGIDIFNLGSGIEYSVREVVAAFERALDEIVTIEVDPARVRKTERMHLRADVSKLKAFIPWSPQVSLDAGVRTLLAGGTKRRNGAHG